MKEVSVAMKRSVITQSLGEVPPLQISDDFSIYRQSNTTDGSRQRINTPLRMIYIERLFESAATESVGAPLGGREARLAKIHTICYEGIYFSLWGLFTPQDSFAYFLSVDGRESLASQMQSWWYFQHDSRDVMVIGTRSTDL